MLTQYQQNTRRLAGNDQTFAKVNDFDLRDWINQARGQVAAEAKCVRAYATLAITSAAQQYPFSAISLPVSPAGVQGVLAVRVATYAVASGQKRVTPREWEWFNRFILASPVPVPAPPRYWAQYGEGAAGTIFVNLPDFNYMLSLDTICYPQAVLSDADPEAIPFLWTDAVPFYAASIAYMQLGDKDKAAEFAQLYQQFMTRARAGATPDVLPHQYAGTSDPTMPNKLGLQRANPAPVA